jgi:hypothetical protein
MNLTTRLHKRAQHRLRSEVMQEQIGKIVNRMLASGRGTKWKIRKEIQFEGTMVGEEWVYSAKLRFERIGREASDEIKEKQIQRMMEIGQDAANASRWQFVDLKRRTSKELDEALSILLKPEDEPITLEAVQDEDVYEAIEPQAVNGWFDHIYEREPQIALVQSSIDAFDASNYNNRFNALLWGEPASGKTEILRAFARKLGPKSVLKLDATSMTRAGVEKILLETDRLPPILLWEEIEKAEESMLRWFLGVGDDRGEVIKTTARGRFSRDIKMLAIGTVNDIKLFNKLLDGALSSRFCNKIYCPRPSKDVIRKILEREILKVNGRSEWIQPAIDYCVDVEKTSDPRRVKFVCLAGMDKLLDGSFQKKIEQSTLAIGAK